MGKPLFYDAGKIEVSQSFIDKIYNVYSDNMHFGAPISSSKTNELDLVRAVLEMLQGLSSNLFSWDEEEKRFCSKTGIHVSHLSLKSLHSVLNRFMYAATCLELVEIVVSKVEKWARTPPPTLRAFASSASAWLRRLRDISLKEQVKIANCGSKFTPTLLELVNSLSSVCSGAEYLLHIVCGAIPQEYFDSVSSVLDADVAVHVLDYLFEKLDEVCLVQGSEEEEYQRVLHMFVGSLLPYMQGLDSWLFEGTLDDPFEEMFFYANKSTSIDDANFWEKSYLFRQAQCPQLDLELPAPTSSSSQGTMAAEKRGKSNVEFESCPLFIKDMAKAVVSAGKSLQLIRHIPVSSSGTNSKVKDCNSKDAFGYGQNLAGLTLSEAFCVSLAGLIGNGDHIFRYLCQDEWHRIKKAPPSGFSAKEKFSSDGRELLQSDLSKKIWYQFLVSTLSEKGLVDATNTHENESNLGEEKMTMEDESRLTPLQSFCTENPAINVCQQNLLNNRDAWKMLNLSRNFYLPPLNDVTLRTAIFGEECCSSSAVEGTNYSYGFQFGESDYQRSNHDRKILETLFPFPTVLPSFKEDCRMSELLPFQKNSTLPSRVLNWVQNFEPKNNVLPVVIIQECLTVFVKKQVDCIGSHMLSKLMNDWRLMEELAVLRAIYLLGSGDLLQHFLTLIFNKLDRGETWDDDFELNTILQESIRNSADSAIISAPDSLVVSLSENQGSSSDEQSNAVPSTSHESRGHIFGKDGLDLLKFTYKVPWPLELIANTEAIKKYNKVMGFLLKVKRAKFLLDKARRWMWKGRGNATNHCKRHWLLEQKLLHFVDAFHQYVMDRVYHSAWQELCKSMSEARSLDEVIEVHESYLLSIERQCFLVRDKLWVVIAERINSILKLALDFYSIQQTLSGGAVSSIKAKCETEIDRIDKDFDKCITFLLTILSFKLNVGNFPHLADLVTRINYNYFYMPDTGNLMTVLAS